MRHLLVGPPLLALSAAACQQLPAPTPAPPNVILLMADDQGFGDLGLRHPRLRTPHLDRLARRGVHLTRFYASAPVCSPTRGSCLTGMHHSRLGIRTANHGHLRAAQPQLASMLKARGFATGHFGKWHLGTLTRDQVDANRGGRRKHDGDYAPPWLRAFDSCFSTESKVPTSDPMRTPPRWAGGVARRTPGEPYGTAYWNERGEVVQDNLAGDNSARIMDRVLPFLRRAHQAGKPSLAVVWFHAPHLPVIGTEAHLAPYADVEDRLTRHYYACISALDAQVGRLQAALAEMGTLDNTLIIYCSDNGPEGREGKAPGSSGGLRGRKRSLYEGGLRVPAMLSWPARRGLRTELDQPCGVVDILPTVWAAVGGDPAELSPDLDGINLLPLLEGRQAQRGRALGFAFGQQAAWIEGSFKWYRRRDRSELYDLARDPSESRDLSVDLPERTRRMQQAWEFWRASCRQTALDGNDVLGAGSRPRGF